MRKLLLTLAFVAAALGAAAQKNMVAFGHMSFDAEVGLHGFGVELALPVQKHLVLKAGYNWSPKNDLFNTDITIDTRNLRDAQEQYESYSVLTGHPYTFQNRFADEAVINASVKLGVTNYKVMLNYYPFMSRKFYIAGGAYYSADKENPEALLTVRGQTTADDWAALQELRTATGNDDYEIALTLADTRYPVVEKDGCGYMQADFKMDALKYYVGFGSGRCIPNHSIGLQFELGAMICHNSMLVCQGKEVKLETLGESFGPDVKEIMEYVDKYPIYPQLTLRLCFRLF